MKTISISKETKDRFDRSLQIFSFLKGTPQTHEAFISFLLEEFWEQIDEELLQDRLRAYKNQNDN